MPKTKIGNFLQQLAKQITNGIKDRTIRKAKEPSLTKQFNELKAQMLADFNNLPIIDALDYGPGYGNTDVANLLGGYGDLFSFLGFPRNRKPANKIRALIKRMKLERVDSFGFRVAWRVVGFPTMDEVEEVTKDDLPWIKGKSWVTFLEQGVPGLGQYLNKNNLDNPPSRSNFGIQSKYTVRPSRIVRAPKWMSSFLQDYFRRFESLSKDLTV